MAIELRPPIEANKIQQGGRNYSPDHQAKDIAVQYGTPVDAAYDGVVVRASYHVPGPGARSYGNVVIIEHKVPCGDGKFKYFYTLYMHTSQKYSFLSVKTFLPVIGLDRLETVETYGIR